MLEWTICSGCGKILDNSQEICQDCNNPVEKVNIDYLAGYVSNLTFLIDTITVFKDLSPSLGNIDSPKALVMDDLFRWFGYLGLADGKVTDNELEFINGLLNTDYSADDIMMLGDVKLEDLPLSFDVLCELDSHGHDLNMVELNSAGELFGCYNLLGKFFITCDNALDEEVFNKYSSYIANLEARLGQKGIDLRPVRIKKDFTKPEYDEEISQDSTSLDESLDKLNKLIGLEKVKKDVNSLINLVQIRKIRSERGLSQPAMSLHLVFSGNPGTGKTTVARLLAEIYHKIGILSKGHLVETDRSGLVGGYVGQTAIKTREVISKALGGILFIDEAYSLASDSENDYGKEAVDTFLKAMEDHRDDLVVIVAGYPALMENFLYSNPGLESRFNKFIYFDDYNAEQLYEIFRLMCEESHLTLDEGADRYVREYFQKMYENRSKNFANGRAVRNLFEEVLTAQANRLAPKKDISDDELNTLIYEDFLIE